MNACLLAATDIPCSTMAGREEQGVEALDEALLA